MINLMCQLPGLKGAQIAGKILFLGVSVRVFPERWAFKLVDWIRKIIFTNAGGFLLTVWAKQKHGRRANTLSAWVGTPILFCSSTSALLVLRPLDLDWDLHSQTSSSQALGFGLGLNHQLSWAATCRWQTVGLLRLHRQVSESLLVNPFLYSYMYVLATGSASLENPD